ncbi:MAG TPA: hypothetical protein VK155_00760 [Bacteroidales bacterium]|jgi:hypothetical protein|nr:hypothetical protein [Bacteroidales bacterium]
MKKIISFLAMAFIVMTVPFTTVAQNTLKNEKEACSTTIDGDNLVFASVGAGMNINVVIYKM